MSLLVFLLFFVLLGIIFSGDLQTRFVALFVGTLLFPNVCLLTTSPSVSPQHLFLYAFLLVEIFRNPYETKADVLENPLRIPFLVLLVSYIGTAVFGSTSFLKDSYYGIRDFVDTFAYLFIAYGVGKRTPLDDFAKRIIPFLVVCCLLGILEAALNENIPYKIINSAFPHYNGIYNLDSSVSLSQDWRIRTCFTTKHPTAWGTLLLGLFLFYLPYLRTESISRPKVVSLLGLLGFNIVLCGSRTAWVCLTIGVFLYLTSRFRPIFKIIVYGVLLFCSSIILAFMLSQFAHSKGSSLDFRMRQLVFSYVTIQNAPVFGNGNGFSAHNLFEEGESSSGARRVQDKSGNDMGGLESIVFKLLIDRGFVGLFSYYLLLAWLFVLFFKGKSFKSRDVHISLFVGALFLTMSGSIGNSSAFLFMLWGVELGYICRKEFVHSENEAENG